MVQTLHVNLFSHYFIIQKNRRLVSFGGMCIANATQVWPILQSCTDINKRTVNQMSSIPIKYRPMLATGWPEDLSYKSPIVYKKLPNILSL